MKKLLLLVIVLNFVSCATSKIPAEPCEMKIKEKISMFDRDIKFKGGVARYDGGVNTCMFYFFKCRYTQTSIDKNNNIFVEGSGLFNSKKKVAVLKGNKVVFEKHFLDSIAKVSDMEVSKEDNMVYRKTDSKLIASLVGKKASSHRDGVSFNEKCTLKEAAIGAITLNTARGMQL